MERVCLCACSDYEDRAALSAALCRIVDTYPAVASRLAGADVLIKPNLVMGKAPRFGATTHPALLEELILLLKARGARRIRLAECPGGPGNAASLEATLRVTGIRAVCDRHGVEILHTTKAKTVPVADGVAVSELQLHREMTEAEVFFNLGKLKSHSLTTFTGCAKNLYGAIPGLLKVEYHARFAEVSDFADLICDINCALRPTLSILDAVLGMEGNGPTGGEPRELGFLIGGENPFAIDALGAELIGVSEADAPILKAARERGLLSDYEVVGDDPAALRVPDFRLADAQRFSLLRSLPRLGALRRVLEPRPVISARCVGCGECATLCPAKAIRLRRERDGRTRAHIHARTCIRCYCCQELCPKKAVDTKSLGVMKL